MVVFVKGRVVLWELGEKIRGFPKGLCPFDYLISCSAAWGAVPLWRDFQGKSTWVSKGTCLFGGVFQGVEPLGYNIPLQRLAFAKERFISGANQSVEKFDWKALGYLFASA